MLCACWVTDKYLEMTPLIGLRYYNCSSGQDFSVRCLAIEGFSEAIDFLVIPCRIQDSRIVCRGENLSPCSYILANTPAVLIFIQNVGGIGRICGGGKKEIVHSGYWRILVFCFLHLSTRGSSFHICNSLRDSINSNYF